MAVSALAALYTVMSLASLMAYAVDKRAAERGRRRIPENVLHLLSLFGGWPGATLAQDLFRHKTRKISFLAKHWAVSALSCGITVGLLLVAGDR